MKGSGVQKRNKAIIFKLILSQHHSFPKVKNILSSVIQHSFVNWGTDLLNVFTILFINESLKTTR